MGWSDAKLQSKWHSDIHACALADRGSPDDRDWDWAFERAPEGGSGSGDVDRKMRIGSFVRCVMAPVPRRSRDLEGAGALKI